MSQLRKDENENVSDEEYVRFFEEVLDDINNPDDAEAIHKDMKIGGGAYSSFSTTTDKISYNYVYTNLTRLSDAAAEYEKKHSSLSTKGYGWDRYEFSKQLQTFADSAIRSKPPKDIIKAASRDKGQDLLNGFISGTDKSLKEFESKLNQPVKVTKLNKANHKQPQTPSEKNARCFC